MIDNNKDILVFQEIDGIRVITNNENKIVRKIDDNYMKIFEIYTKKQAPG